jgi:hypothetical protein
MLRNNFPPQSIAEQALGAAISGEKHVAVLSALFLKRAALFDQQSALLGASSRVVQFSVPAIPR